MPDRVKRVSGIYAVAILGDKGGTMISKDVIKGLIFDMLEDKYKTRKFREDLYADIQVIVDDCEDIADYIERGRYDMTDEKVRAEHEHYDPRI